MRVFLYGAYIVRIFHGEDAAFRRETKQLYTFSRETYPRYLLVKKLIANYSSSVNGRRQSFVELFAAFTGDETL